MPKPRWAVAAVILVAFVGGLVVHSYASAQFRPDGVGERGIVDLTPPEILGGGPIIDATTADARTFRLPPKTVALTFDDGPDPRWTPAVAEVLRRHQINATFFQIGSEITRYPAIVRDLAAAGDEIGIHSFTHPQMDHLPRWRQQLEYSQTQLAIVNATGKKSALLRFPYSSHVDSIDDANWDLIQDAGKLGYVTVMSDVDGRDWERPGVDAIVRSSIPEGDDGSIVLMHDAGGDRSQTLAALDTYIPLMKQRGWQFVTVSQGLALALAAEEEPAPRKVEAASAGDMWRARALVTTFHIGDALVELLTWLFYVVGGLTVVRTLVMFALALGHARRRRSKKWTWGPPVNDPVSVVVPAYNEKEGIEAAVRSLAGGDYAGGIEVVVVDDGSTDGTADLVQALKLPNVRLVRTPNGGKSSALNTGVALARHDLIVMVDGDTVFEPDSVRQLVQPFADPAVGAVAGNVKVGNRKSVVAGWQHIEYVIGFNLDRRLYDVLRCMPTVPGAIGAFRRAALAQAGGISDDTLAEDTDITMALCRAGWRVVYEERARAWTEAPTTLRQLWLQRYRWSYGTMQAMWKHRRSLVERGASGRFGRLGLPFIALFGVALPLLAPIIDILLVYGLLLLDRRDTAIAWLAMLALQMLTAVVAFRLDREKLRALWVLPLQQFVYRQLMYLVLVQSAITALTGARLRWHKLTRAGTAAVGAPANPPPAVSPAPVVTATPVVAAAPVSPAPIGAVAGPTRGRAAVPAPKPRNPEPKHAWEITTEVLLGQTHGPHLPEEPAPNRDPVPAAMAHAHAIGVAVAAAANAAHRRHGVRGVARVAEPSRTRSIIDAERAPG